MSRKVFFKLIVPNYNNMAYIKQCLDSIVQQKFQNFICVVVDDMSTDMSDKLVEYYERRYPGKIKLIKHTEKKYAGGARNTGLKYDKYEADYIWFIDSDDMLYDDTVLQKMHDKILKSENPDILRVGSVWKFKSGLSNKRAYTNLKFIIDNTWHAPWWNCINAKFADVTFQEGLPIFNDALWFAKLLDRIDQKKVVELEETCYIYNMISSTGCHSILKDDVKNAAKRQLELALTKYKPTTELSQYFVDKILELKCGKKKSKPKKEVKKDQPKKANEPIVEKPLQKVNEKVDKCFFKIIVPNYNNMAYIKQCLDSILNQTFQDFKIIVVDDMSTDMSDKFCETYSRKYPDKIVYMQVKEKSYAGICRNIAIDYPIECEYIWAIDGDDYLVDNKVLEILHKHAKSLKYDAIFFNGYKDVDGNLIRLKDRKQIDLNDLEKCDPTYHICSIAKPECFGRYLEHCMVGQDLYHSYLTLDNIKTYINLYDRLYVYRFNPCSVSNRTQSFKQRQIKEQHRKFLKTKLEELQKSIKNKKIVKNIDQRLQMIQAQIDKNSQSGKIRKIVVAMASFPPRKAGMLNVIRQLLPQCDKFCLWLNDYAEIPKELNNFDKNKLHIVLAGKDSDLKENGRYLFINENKDSYFLSVDDDINYPSNYVARFIGEINNYNQKCILSFHGTIFDKNMHEKYFPFSANVPKDVQVHRVGGGVMGFVPSEIGFSCPDINTLREWDGDASISVWATNNGIKKYVIAHSAVYLTDQVDISSKKKMSHINALCLNSSTKRKRKKIYEQIKEWEKLA